MSLPPQLFALKTLIEHHGNRPKQQNQLLNELDGINSLLGKLESTDSSYLLAALNFETFKDPPFKHITTTGGGKCPFCGRGG